MTITHRQTGTLTYKSWQKMVARCRCETDVCYPFYGAVGITVVDEWVGAGGFERFLAHIGERPSREYTVDRRANAQGYAPGNVRWATKGEQARNRKSNILITIDGVTKCAMDWGRANGLEPDAVYMRIKNGWDHVDAVTKPHATRRPITKHARLLTVDGQTKTLTAWARELGLSKETLAGRLRRGWSAQDAVLGRSAP